MLKLSYFQFTLTLLFSTQHKMWAQGDMHRAEVSQGKARGANRHAMKQVLSVMDEFTIRDRNNNDESPGSGDEKPENGSRLFTHVSKAKVVCFICYILAEL